MKTLSISIIFGVLISFSLFWLMQIMISNDQQHFKKTDNLHMTEFVRLKRETKLQMKERKMPEEPKPEERPSPPKMSNYQTHISPTTAPQMSMPNLDIPLQSNAFTGSIIAGVQIGGSKGIKTGTSGISTNVIPLVRIKPRYPMRAANRRIEGWVKVEFTITKTGTVKDPVVIEAQPKNIFNRAALKAIRRWKFKAKIMGGEAFEQRAIQVLQFKLSK